MSTQFPSVRMIDGEVLFREGNMADCFYLIEQGRVLVLDRPGINVLRFYEKDQLFGIPEVLAGAFWPHTAVVSGQTLIRIFPSRLLFERMEKMPASHQDFITSMAALGN